VSLSEVVEDLWVKFAGNRVNLVGKLLVLEGIALPIIEINSPHRNQSMFVGGLSVVVGLFLYRTTRLHGENLTFAYYQRTKDHIRKFGRLTKRFAKEALKRR